MESLSNRHVPIVVRTDTTEGERRSLFELFKSVEAYNQQFKRKSRQGYEICNRSRLDKKDEFAVINVLGPHDDQQRATEQN